MAFWLIDDHTPGYGLMLRVEKVIYTEQTPYQHLAIVDTIDFGRALVLDGIVQTTIRDEFIYHEMIAHVPLFTHPNPQSVLIIGGGDGGTAREVLKHVSVERLDLVEIDAAVVKACKNYLLETACAFDDPRLNVVYSDGVDYVHHQKGVYDVVIVDSSDPLGPAVQLYTREFYQNVFDSLKEDGLFVAQTDSPQLSSEHFKKVYINIQSVFPLTKVYLTCVPSYLSGFWSFTLGSKFIDPTAHIRIKPAVETKFYSPELHVASFVLPRSVTQLTKKN